MTPRAQTSILFPTIGRTRGRVRSVEEDKGSEMKIALRRGRAGECDDDEADDDDDEDRRDR